ncbi:MAG: hypothetical protein HFJ09_16320 [Lachnospiraceae bacterium]|nr:hypothetical protein [Lachnospiraceae bacterium]
MKKQGKRIFLPEGYWQEKYKKYIQDGSVPETVLLNETTIWLEDQNISCEPIQYMKNLKEMVVHNCVLKEFHCVCEVENIRRMTFVETTFDKEDLSVLMHSPNLKQLSLNRMSARGAEKLYNKDSLKIFSIRTVTDFSYKELQEFQKLTILEVVDMNFYDYTFLTKMEKLTSLEIIEEGICNLDFLPSLKNLVTLCIRGEAQDESSLPQIRHLKKLKKFCYPVKDLSVYQNMTQLKSIGVCKEGLENIGSLAGSNVNYVNIFSTRNKEEEKSIIEEIKKYVKLTGYGIIQKSNQ